jgi:hypothetical protein
LSLLRFRAPLHYVEEDVLGIPNSMSRTRKRKATKEIGEVAAMQFIPAVGNERKRTRND